MLLFIDLSEPVAIRLGVYQGGAWSEHVTSFEHSGGLMGWIQDVFDSLGQPLSAISAIGVVLGKGRFTATRIAVTVANSLGFALQVPVVGVRDLDLNDELVKKLESTTGLQYVAAEYSAEAHIGGKQQPYN